MANITIDVTGKTSQINLGIQGENIVENVIFDISSWIDEYGEGVAYIYAKRKGDTEPYPIALTMDLDVGTATWEVTAVDTAYKGKGFAQLIFVSDDDAEDAEVYSSSETYSLGEYCIYGSQLYKCTTAISTAETWNAEHWQAVDEVKKTKVYKTTVQASINATSTENPSAYDTWLETLGGFTSRIEQAYEDTVTAKEAAEDAQEAAELAQTGAEAEAKLARSYARGDTSSRTGETTDNSKYYSEQSAASAGTAANEAIAAAGSAVTAGLAKVDAQAAQTAAETAQGKAETAQEKAETAQGKAEDAQTAAETAQGKAEDAQTAAETAQGKAEDAQEAAETAQGKAEDAQEAAETAQGLAEDARDDAITAKNAAQTYEGKIENMTASAETGAEGSSAAVTKTETVSGFNLHFKIPKGDTGKGVSSVEITEEYKLKVNYTDGTSWTSPQSIQGPSGVADNLGLAVVDGVLNYEWIES